MKRSTAPTDTFGPPSSDEFALRELEAFFRAEDPARVAAALWHTRWEQGLSELEERQFQQWLSSDVAHADAFAHIDDSLGFVHPRSARQAADVPLVAPAASALPDRSIPAVVPANAPIQASASRHRAEQSPLNGFKRWLGTPMRARMASLAVCCVVLAAVGIGWMHWLSQPIFVQSFVAQRGERIDVPLPDGTQLALDADTQLDVRLFRDHREVRLTRGQAMFSVAHDASKPFVVQAGAARITVVGTRFSVRFRSTGPAPSEVDVEVEEGHVKLASTLQEHLAELDLLAGEAAHTTLSGDLSEVSSIDPASIAPWRKGLIHFSSTPLAMAIQEFERYGPSHLLISDPAVAAMPVGGSYLIGSPNAFANVLPRILPVRLLNRPGGDIEIVSRK